jgi:hypothetical protein
MKLANYLQSYRDTLISFSLSFKQVNATVFMMNTVFAGSRDERRGHSAIGVQWDEEMIINCEMEWINEAIIVLFQGTISVYALNYGRTLPPKINIDPMPRLRFEPNTLQAV